MTLRKLWNAIKLGIFGKPEAYEWPTETVDPAFAIPPMPMTKAEEREIARQMLESRINLVREMAVSAKLNKKRWKHHEAKWKSLCAQRAKMEGER